MKILIIEDEIPAKEKLAIYLRNYFGPSLELHAIRSVNEGIELLSSDENQYNLILSDIKLLDGSAFEIFSRVESKTPIIFCSAYNEHLLEAFKVNGIAYILKPYTENELKDALLKYENLFQSFKLESSVFDHLQVVLRASSNKYKTRCAIKKNDGIQLIEDAQISLIQASGDFCRIIDAEGGLHSTSKSIGMLHQELNPASFFKINRSQIININHIEKIRPGSKNRLIVIMTGVKEHPITSSAKTKEFRQWLEG